MIWSDFHFYSQALGIQTAAYVLLPEDEVLRKRGGKPLPTLYLLHGLSDDHTSWLRNTRIAKYAVDYELAIVMPAANRSFYTDMAHGAKYWTFVSEELPGLMERCFPLATTRAGRFAAGLSMGGYGAMKLGLQKPGRYAAVAALSAPLMLQEAFRFDSDPAWHHEMEGVFGDEASLRAGEGNLSLSAEALPPELAPRMYAACGTDDFLFEANEAFMKRFGPKFAIRYVTTPGAAHTWDYWDVQIREVLRWLPLEPSGAKW